MKRKKALAQGYILEETENTVVIATGFLRPSQNTGRLAMQALARASKLVQIQTV